MGVEANAPTWYRRGRRNVLVFAFPLVAFYSCLFWAPDGTLVSLHTRQPQHGGLFFWYAAYGWALIGGGLWQYTSAASRIRLVSTARTTALSAAIAVPLLVNIAYAFGLLGALDPTPALLGPTALMIRFAVVEPGLSLFLPLARKDIVEQLAVGVVVADIHDRVLDSNASARRLLGIADPRGMPLDDLCEGLDETIEAVRFPLRTHFDVAGSAAVLTDRREAIESERRLQVAGRLQAVGSLTAGMAHEINNPLAFIRSNLNLIEKLVAELHSPDVNNSLPARIKPLALDGAESLVDAKDGIDRISQLVARLKDFARQTTAEPRDHAEVDLIAAAERAVAMAAVGVAPGAIRITGEPGSTICSSEPAIVQILVNLVLNAVQATEGTPDITIEVVATSEGAEIRVADCGPGLPGEVLEQVFDPFFTTKEAGNGLGLSISFELAQQLGGRISAANRPDGGAVFSLHLGRARESGS